MSTKIFNAYRFNASAFALLDHLRNFRPVWHAIQISRLTTHILRGEGGLVADSKTLRHDLHAKIEAQSTSRFPKHDDLFDVRGSCAVYFDRGGVYVQLFMQPVDPAHLIDKRFEDFHYQNQSDPWYEYEDNMAPVDRTKAARNWRLRERVWDRIFSHGLDSPAEAGLCYEFCTALDYHSIATLVVEKVRAA